MPQIFAFANIACDQEASRIQRQLLEAGYSIDATRFVEERGSEDVEALHRPMFIQLLSRMKAGDTLVVPRLICLGSTSPDALRTVRLLSERKIRLFVVELGAVDLTTPAGSHAVRMLELAAELDPGLRIRPSGGGLNGPARKSSKTTEEDRREIRRLLSTGATVAEVTKALSISRSTVLYAVKSAKRRDESQDDSPTLK